LPQQADSPPGGAGGHTHTMGSRQRGSTFASLSIPEYRVLFISGAVSFLATQVQLIGRGWLANDLTDSSSGLGGVYMAFGIAMLIATPIGGVLADRRSRRALLLVTQATFAIVATYVGLAVQFGFIRYWMLLITAVLQAVAFSLLAPARMAMTAEVVGRDLLSNAVVLGQMSMNSTRIIGPAIAGVGLSVAWFGTVGVYYTAAVLSMVGFVLVLRLPPTPRPTPRPTPTGRSAGREFLDGLRYARSNALVGWMLLGSTLVVMVGLPYLAFLPRVASATFDAGPGVYGMLSVASAVGAVIVSFLIASVGAGARAWRVQWVSAGVFTLGLVILGLSSALPLTVIAVFVAGAGSSAFQSMNGSLVLAHTDAALHGRVQSLMMLAFSGFGMAALPLGAVADGLGLPIMFIAMAVVVGAATIAYRLAGSRVSGTVAEPVPHR
jgi:MFS family permease